MHAFLTLKVKFLKNKEIKSWPNARSTAKLSYTKNNNEMNTFYDEIAIIQPSRASVMVAGVNKQVFFAILIILLLVVWKWSWILFKP